MKQNDVGEGNDVEEELVVTEEVIVDRVKEDGEAWVKRGKK